MTTIAFRDGVMAADTTGVSGGVIMPATKLVRKGGWIIGFSGEYLPAWRYLKVFDMKMPDQPASGDFELLIWDGNHLYEDDGHGAVRIPPVPFYAIGGGAGPALGAMHMGASAKEATKIAVKIDAGTNGRVVSMKLGK